MAGLGEGLFAVSALAQQIWEKRAKRQVPSSGLFCPCLSTTEYPELEGSWKDGVKVTGVKACLFSCFTLEAGFGSTYATCPVCMMPGRSWRHFPL